MIYTNRCPYCNDIWDTSEISMKALNCWSDEPPTGFMALMSFIYTPFPFKGLFHVTTKHAEGREETANDHKILIGGTDLIGRTTNVVWSFH